MLRAIPKLLLPLGLCAPAPPAPSGATAGGADHPDSLLVEAPNHCLSFTPCTKLRFEHGSPVGICDRDGLLRTTWESPGHPRSAAYGPGRIVVDDYRGCSRCASTGAQFGPGWHRRIECTYSGRVGAGEFTLTVVTRITERHLCRHDPGAMLPLVGEPSSLTTIRESLRGRLHRQGRSWEVRGESIKRSTSRFCQRRRREWRRVERVHRKRFTAPVQVIDPDQGAWYGGLYLAARGQESPELAGAMARVERFLADLEQSLERGDLELARCQSGQLRRGLAGLRDQARARGVRLRLRGLPTGEAVAEAHRLRAAGESMRALHREARERQARVGRRLEELRTHFSPKAVKGLVRSALSWRRLVEPHPLEGLAGYSDLAARTALPGHLLGWCEEAARDGSPGAGPGQAIRRLERFERCLDRYAAGIAAARREAFARLRSRGAGEAARIHAALQAALRGRGK